MWVIPQAASCPATTAPISSSNSGWNPAPRAMPEGKLTASWINAPHSPSMWKIAGIWWGLFSMTTRCTVLCQSAAVSSVSSRRISRVLTSPMPKGVCAEIQSIS